MTGAPARFFWVAALTLGIAACSSSPTGPTGSGGTPTVATTTELFTGTLVVMGSKGRQFSVFQTGAKTSIMLASLLSNGSPVPSTTTVKVGIGTWNDPDCTLTSPTSYSPSLQPAFSVDLSVGTQCVGINDAGTLTGPVDFAIRIVHP